MMSILDTLISVLQGANEILADAAAKLSDMRKEFDDVLSKLNNEALKQKLQDGLNSGTISLPRALHKAKDALDKQSAASDSNKSGIATQTVNYADASTQTDNRVDTSAQTDNRVDTGDQTVAPADSNKTPTVTYADSSTGNDHYSPPAPQPSGAGSGPAGRPAGTADGLGRTVRLKRNGLQTNSDDQVLKQTTDIQFNNFLDKEFVNNESLKEDLYRQIPLTNDAVFVEKPGDALSDESDGHDATAVAGSANKDRHVTFDLQENSASGAASPTSKGNTGTATNGTNNPPAVQAAQNGSTAASSRNKVQNSNSFQPPAKENSVNKPSAQTVVKNAAMSTPSSQSASSQNSQWSSDKNSSTSNNMSPASSNSSQKSVDIPHSQPSGRQSSVDLNVNSDKNQINTSDSVKPAASPQSPPNDQGSSPGSPVNTKGSAPAASPQSQANGQGSSPGSPVNTNASAPAASPQSQANGQGAPHGSPANTNASAPAASPQSQANGQGAPPGSPANTKGYAPAASPQSQANGQGAPPGSPANTNASAPAASPQSQSNGQGAPPGSPANTKTSAPAASPQSPPNGQGAPPGMQASGTPGGSVPLVSAKPLERICKTLGQRFKEPDQIVTALDIVRKGKMGGLFIRNIIRAFQLDKLIAANPKLGPLIDELAAYLNSGVRLTKDQEVLKRFLRRRGYPKN